MRPLAEREIVAFLAAGDINASQIADITRIPRSTVREWLVQPEPRIRRTPSLDLASLPMPDYSYLLGFYLGDGTITRHRRDVFRLTITTDAMYPGLIAECAAAMGAVMPQNRVLLQRCRSRAIDISCYSKSWPLLFPQHGPGRKHTRKIELVPWQQDIVERFPRELLRGLIHSDGCRVLNRVNEKDYPRYFFHAGVRRHSRHLLPYVQDARHLVHAEQLEDHLDRAGAGGSAPRRVRRAEDLNTEAIVVARGSDRTDTCPRAGVGAGTEIGSSDVRRAA